MNKPVILIGGGGHAKVVADCILSCGGCVAGVLDDRLPPGHETLPGIPVLGSIAEYEKYAGDCSFIIAIGSCEVRRRLAGELQVSWRTAIHPTAAVSRFAEIGEGCYIGPHAAVNACAVIGAHSIINTGAVVEHDNIIGAYSHISPGAILGGSVTIGEGTQICMGACVRNNIMICGGCVIGAGAVAVKDIDIPGTYAGVPAKLLKQIPENNT